MEAQKPFFPRLGKEVCPFLLDLSTEWDDRGQVRNMKVKPVENGGKAKEPDEMLWQEKPNWSQVLSPHRKLALPPSLHEQHGLSQFAMFP